METVFLISATWREFTKPLEALVADPANGIAEMQVHGHRICLDFGSSRVYLDRYDTVAREHEPEELAAIEAEIATPCFFGVDFSNERHARLVLLAIANDDTLLVEDDYGSLLRGSAFVRLLRQFPNWDWRTERRPFPYLKSES